MGLRDAFKGDKWYAPLGVSKHGGGAYAPHENPSQKKAREKSDKIAELKREIKNCGKCKKLSKGQKGITCAKHAKTATQITKLS